MKEWRIPKAALESALNILFTVTLKYSVDTSLYIKFEKYKDSMAKLSLSSEFSGIAYLSAESGCPLKEPVYLDRRMLEPFVMAGKDLSPGYYTMQVEHGQVTLIHGHRVGKFTSNKKSKGYLNTPDVDGKLQRITDEMVAVANCARHIAVDDPIAPHLACVYAFPRKGRLIMLSANEHQFFFGSCKLPKHFSLEKAALPLPLVDCMQVENKVKLIYSDKIAVLRFSCGVLWHSVKREARKNFPRDTVESMVKEGLNGETILTLDSNVLYDAASRADKYMQSVESSEAILKIEVKKGSSNMEVKCNTSGADFVEHIKLGSASKGEVLIDWPLADIIPVLDYCKKEGIVRISRDEKGRTCFSAGSIAMLIARKIEKKTKSKKKGSKNDKAKSSQSGDSRES